MLDLGPRLGGLLFKSASLGTPRQSTATKDSSLLDVGDEKTQASLAI